MPGRAWIVVAVVLAGTTAAQAQQDRLCTRQYSIERCCEPAAEDADVHVDRLLRYAELETEHRLCGLASYYSTFFEGRKTANGEIYRNGKYSAAHLTLPLGSWIEVTSRATGKKLRLRVNDRGPFAKKFMLDLSQAAARFLGVDVAPDRHVDVRLIALPGEEPLPEEIDVEPLVHAIASATTAQ